MKLCICVIHSRDKQRVSDELIRSGFKFTMMGSTGGFLGEGNTTLMIGCDESEVAVLAEILNNHCQSRDQVVNVPTMEAGPQGAFIPAPIHVPVGGAVLFVMNVERFERY